MVYRIFYKKESRNWGQHSLEDYNLVDKNKHEQYLDNIEEEKWKLKKKYYQSLSQKEKKNIPPLRRGRKKTRYPTRERYFMDNPTDVAAVKRFKWFTPIWNQSRNSKAITPIKGQLTIIQIFPQAFYSKVKTYVSNTGRLIIPKFHMPRYISKNEFCYNMSDWAWEACRPRTKVPGQTSHIFYLNDFSMFDEPSILQEIRWGKKDGILPSDVIKFELFRLLQGFSTYNDFFRMIDMMPNMNDHCAINMTHNLPSSHHFTELLRKVSAKNVKLFFEQLVFEARTLGLIRDRVHIWDGQFHETWLKRDKPRSENLQQFYGGVYNHGGKKVGIGVSQSTIMDWNGYCAIPIYTEIFCANENDNTLVKNSVNHSYKSNNPVPQYFLADRGPSGMKTQMAISNFGAIPIIPLTKNVKNGIRITAKKHHRFYTQFSGTTSDLDLEKLYTIRTRIEEHYSHNDVVYKSARLHCSGKEMTEIEIYLLNILGVLVPLTAYKIGRPDLMWSPSKFRNIRIHPERIFPEQYRELNNLRWDEDVSVSPSDYKRRKYN